MAASGTSTTSGAKSGMLDYSREPERRGQFSASLKHGLEMLCCFTPERPELGISRLADELHLSRASTHRYAATLVALGYLEQGPSRRYRLAPNAAYPGLALLDTMAPRELAHPVLKELRDRTGRTVNMAIIEDLEILYIDRLPGWRQGRYAIDLDLGLGSRLPLHCTAMGKVLLAHLPELEREKTITKLKLTREGPNSIRTKKELRTELDRVRAGGIAVNDEELVGGLISIAVPIRDASGRVAVAINIAVPKSGCTREEVLEGLAPRLRAAAEQIEAALKDRAG